MSEIVAKDFVDREIKVGDVCAYPVRRGSKMWLNRLLVQAIVADIDGSPKLKGQNRDGHPVTISSLDRVVIIGRNNTVPMLED